MIQNGGLIWLEGMLGVLVACGLFIAWRLSKLSARRAEAERRATAAFEEMNRLTRELRERKKVDGAGGDGALSPGERLQRMYPGRAAPPRSIL